MFGRAKQNFSLILNMERYEAAQDVFDEVWNDPGEENVSDRDRDFRNLEENSGANEDEGSIDSYDSKGVGTGLLNGVGSRRS